MSVVRGLTEVGWTKSQPSTICLIGGEQARRRLSDVRCDVDIVQIFPLDIRHYRSILSLSIDKPCIRQYILTKLSWILKLLFFFDNITYRRAIEEREIKYHFISRCSKGTPLAQRAIKLTLLTAHYFIAR